MKKTSVFAAALAMSVLVKPALAEEGKTLESIVAGTGKVKFNSLLQGWVYNDTSSLTDPRMNFRLRRAELKFTGSVVENTRWFLMIDPAKILTLGSTTVPNGAGGTTTVTGTLSNNADNKILQDFGVAFMIIPDLELTVGQFKTPTTAEGLDSSAELIFPERSLNARQYGDRRDQGAIVTYAWEMLKFNAMVSNGVSPNAIDTNNSKDLTVRVDAKANDWIKLGAFTQAGDFKYYNKGRWGANARFAPGDALFRLEGVHATDFGTLSNGYTVDGGYAFMEKWQPVVRYSNVNFGTFAAQEANLGVNYYILKHNAKIQASGGWLKNAAGVYGTPAPAKGRGGTLIQVNFQAAI